MGWWCGNTTVEERDTAGLVVLIGLIVPCVGILRPAAQTIADHRDTHGEVGVERYIQHAFAGVLAILSIERMDAAAEVVRRFRRYNVESAGDRVVAEGCGCSS